jgi:fumarate hydratase subunit beta
MRTISLELPLRPEDIAKLSKGDKVLLSGEVLTARDAAHAKLEQLITQGKPLPFDLSSTCLFYCGPSPTPEGKICGAIGPTTSARMDKYTPLLLEYGLKAMIGKGERSDSVTRAIRDKHAVYLVCLGGISALLSQSVVSCETFCWEELGAEAIYRLLVKNMPAYVDIV